jgi:glutamate racemase
VPLVEAGEQDSEIAGVLLHEYLRPLLSEHIDTLILGCTHYGILEEKICAMVGSGVHVVSERDVMPEKLANYLECHPEIDLSGDGEPTLDFYSTGPLNHFNTLGSIFFGKTIHAKTAVLG